MAKSLVPILVLMITAFAPSAKAHGIDCTASRSGPVMLLECAYDPSGAVRHADVQVFGPSDPRAVYQSGRTDPHGRFAFLPDQSGAWRVVADDQLGHREEVLLTIEEKTGPVASESTTLEHRHDAEAARDGARAPVQAGPADAEIPLLYKVLFGLSLIWGAAGLWYGYKVRQTRPDAQPT